MGFWTVLSNAVYAYSGVEGIAVAAAETQSPRQNIPIAAKRIFWRVLIFYGALNPAAASFYAVMKTCTDLSSSAFHLHGGTHRAIQ